MINHKKYLRFQHDINNGLTLTEALTKHGLNFKETFEYFRKKQWKEQKTKPKRKPESASQYIQKRNGHYYLRKNVYIPRHKKSVTRMFGTYKTLEDAERMREALKKDGWHVTHVDRICRELGIERCTYHNTRARYH